jgi:hypothetical protein
MFWKCSKGQIFSNGYGKSKFNSKEIESRFSSKSSVFPSATKNVNDEQTIKITEIKLLKNSSYHLEYHYASFFLSFTSVLYRSPDEKSPISSFFPQSFLFNFLPHFSSLLEVFRYRDETSHCALFYRSLFFKIYS